MEKAIVSIWGEEKTSKTTLALTFPKPIVFYEFDIGGFDRAAWRFKGQDITCKSFPTPLPINKMMGAQGPSVRFPRRIEGMVKVWQSFLTAFAEDLQDKSIATMIFDSGTQLWYIDHQAFLQEKQEIQLNKGMKEDDDKFREKLKPVEYGEPNTRFRSLIYGVRSFKKNLVIIHYPRDIYAQKLVGDKVLDYKTDKIEPDGFKENRRLASLELWTYLNDEQDAVVKITKSGLTKGSAVYGVVLEPNYESIANLIEMVRSQEDVVVEEKSE